MNQALLDFDAAEASPLDSWYREFQAASLAGLWAPVGWGVGWKVERIFGKQLRTLRSSKTWAAYAEARAEALRLNADLQARAA